MKLSPKEVTLMSIDSPPTLLSSHQAQTLFYVSLGHKWEALNLQISEFWGEFRAKIEADDLLIRFEQKVNFWSTEKGL